MKKLFTFSAFSLLMTFTAPLSATADTHIVSTDATKKNVLIEDFTGIHCTYCPDGHKIAARIHRNHPTQTYILAIHTGNYANPGRDEPDFRTAEGLEVNNGFGITGYPAGIVNRTLYSESRSGLVINRSLWTPATKAQIQQDASVNLAATAHYDGQTKKMSVMVEGYYTKVDSAWTPRLTVVWVQDHVQGPQTGGQLGEDYIHNHLVRGYLNGAWGEALTAPQQGAYFTKEYTFDVPETIKTQYTAISSPVRPEDIRIVAYVTNGKEDVQQVTGCVPTFTNYPTKLAATLADPRIPMGNEYGFNYIEACLDNRSSVEISSASFSYEARGKKFDLEWTGRLAVGEVADIQIPWTLDTEADDEDFTLTLTKLNGTAVKPETEAYINYIEGTLSAPKEVPTELNLYIKTNKEANDNHFRLLDADGKPVKEFGPFKQGEVNEEEFGLTLEDGKTYCLEASDEWGDGISGPAGQFKLYDKAGNLLMQVPQISYFGARAFFKASATAGIKGIIASPSSHVRYFGLDGKQIQTQPEGQPYIRMENGKATKAIK